MMKVKLCKVYTLECQQGDEICFRYSALDKLLGKLGIYATWLSSIAYLQKQLRILIFLRHIFFLWLHIFLLHEAIGYVLAYFFTPIVCLSKVSN